MATTTTQTAVQTFAIDKTHSEVLFQVRHLITKVRGRFTNFSGTLQFDEQQPERSTLHFEVAADSIDTSTADRDAHLRSADFFDIERYPTLTFVSTHVARRGEARYDVTGTLTIRGVSKMVTLPVAFLGFAKDPWGNQRAGFETEITINRKDFGLMWNAALETGGFLVGDEVTITVSVQVVRQ